MVTVCDGGWSKHLQHERRILQPGDSLAAGVSHGMCAECSMLVHAEIAALQIERIEATPAVPEEALLGWTRQARKEFADYVDYLSGATLDPRG